MGPNLEVPWLALGGGRVPLCLVLRSIQVRDSRNLLLSHLQTCSAKSFSKFPGFHSQLASGKYEFMDAPSTFQACSVNPRLRGYHRSLYFPKPVMGSKLSVLRHSLTSLWDNLKEIYLGELRPATFLHLLMQIWPQYIMDNDNCCPEFSTLILVS